SALASVQERAAELAAAVRSVDAKRVNLVAHSLGGLDARYAISKLGLHDRVASLVTLGTPHRGTPVADFGIAVADPLGLKRILGAIGFDTRVFYELTTAHMKRFNREVPDARAVWYGSLIARAQSGLHPLLLPIHLALKQNAGENDGLVLSSSQRCGGGFAH